MISLTTSDNVLDIINKNPSGMVFQFSSGVYKNIQITPKNGQHFIGSPGVIFDGAGSSLNSAFNPWGTMPVDVLIKDLKITNYPSQPEFGAVGDQYPSAGWQIENCEICNNGSIGIRLNSNSTVKNCWIHDNGRLGIAGGGGSILIDSNIIESNNISNFDPSGAAGGVKLAQAQLALIINNLVRKNIGAAGIWFDVDCIGCNTIGNVVEDNATGISYEISWGGHCYRNQCHRNKNGDIINSTTVGLLVEENVIDMPVQIWTYNQTQGQFGWHSNANLQQKNNWINGVLVP